MTSFVRLFMPRALLFFISFRVFLNSVIMIGGTSDMSGQAGILLWGMLVLGCRAVQFCVKAQIFRISFLSVCTSFSSIVISHIFFLGPPLCICFCPLPLWSTVSSWSVRFFHDLCLRFFSIVLFSSVDFTFSLPLTYFPSLKFFLLSSSCLISWSSVDSTDIFFLVLPAELMLFLLLTWFHNNNNNRIQRR